MITPDPRQRPGDAYLQESDVFTEEGSVEDEETKLATSVCSATCAAVRLNKKI